MSELIDILEEPAFILRAEFDPYRCCVLGIKIGASADDLEGWEGEPNNANWFHVEGGVAFQVKDFEVTKIKLPRTISERLGIGTIEDLMAHLGKNDDTREIRYRDRLLHRQYIWNKGISAFGEILPKLGPLTLTIFDPAHGLEQIGEITYALLAAKDCLERQPSFQIPPIQESETLKSGDLAKVIFNIKINLRDYFERMWVEVTEVKPEFYQGLLASDPYCTHELKRGAYVQFHADHVIQILRAGSIPESPGGTSHGQ